MFAPSPYLSRYLHVLAVIHTLVVLSAFHVLEHIDAALQELLHWRGALRRISYDRDRRRHALAAQAQFIIRL